MMFRKLYWVTEQVDLRGHSRVTGVYTSIPDLVRRGLNPSGNGRIRLTLTKLDSDQEPLGTWTEPAFMGLAQGLEQFIHTDEFSEEHCNMLLNALSDLHAPREAVA